jgi:hypothetical protein
MARAASAALGQEASSEAESDDRLSELGGIRDAELLEPR